MDSDRGGQLDLYVANLGEERCRRVTTSDRAEQYGRWSLDASEIVFHRHVGPDELDYDSLVVDLQYLSERRLTSSPGDDANPDWSPDRARIAFASSRSGMYDIYSVCSDGSAQTRITAGQSSDNYPYWPPSGEQTACQSDVDGGKSIFLVDAGDGSECR